MKINKKWIAFIVLLIILITVGAVYYYMKNTTYTSIRIVETHESIGTDNGNHIPYADGVLKYSKDGIAFLTQEGKNLWNQSCQMTRPIVEMCGETVAVADMGGTSILVCQKNGLKGEIKTTRPIEKVTVSEQGIVAAILQDTDTPQIMCYDAKGNILVKHNASLENTGYPMDVAISPDGNVLLVSYLYIEGNTIHTRAAYYHFGEAGENKQDHLVAQAEYQDEIVPTAAFIGKTKSLLLSEKSFVLYEGLEAPKEVKKVTLGKEIKSVAYNKNYIAYVLKNTDSSVYELRIYNMEGEQMATVGLSGEYANIQIIGNDIILFSANICAIFNEKGICKYQGTVESHIINFFPIGGLNKYMMISANGFEEVQLAK